ncbi:MAG: hypothetical protein GVY05_07650 [Bacteroidetes bacterium]|jgi:hypothetical protein|nr:hypothetical protein [Bacteroidota bacterium]
MKLFQILFLVAFNCLIAQTNPINSFTNQVYVINQTSEKMFMCDIYFSFNKDSLLIFKTSSQKLRKFNFNFDKHQIYIKKSKNNYSSFQFYIKDGDLIIVDKNHFFSNNDLLRLKKIKIKKFDNNLLKDIVNSNLFWKLDKYESRNNFPHTIWLRFNNNGFVNYYTQKDENSEISHTKNRLDIHYISDSLNLMRIHGDFTYYVISKLNDDEFTLNYFTCNNLSQNVLNFKKYEKKIDFDITGNWRKKQSVEQYELPNTLNIFDAFIRFDNKNKIKYFFGINNKYIHLENNMDLKIISYNKDHLQIGYKNSVHINEIVTYELVD